MSTVTPRAAVLAAVIGGALVGGVIGEFPDLHVYRYAGQAVLDQSAVYGSDNPVNGYPFTYPPFAAVLMVPLALVPSWVAAALLTGASVGCLAGTVLLVRRRRGHSVSWWVILVVAAAALALEPVWQNLSFGQVNLILMLAVLVDLLRPDHQHRRFAGVLVGLAAAVKLTPLVFVVLLVLVGRGEAARRAVAVFLGTIVVGFVVLPRSSATYWTEGLFEPARVGPPELAHNQSVTGALARLLDQTPGPLLWLAVAGPLAIAVTLVAASAWRRGDRVLGTCLGALAMLLAAPVSWSHHWVWAVPIALALWDRHRTVAVAWILIFVARPILWPPWGAGREYDWGALQHVLGNAYLIAAVLLASWYAVRLRRSGADSERVGPARAR